MPFAPPTLRSFATAMAVAAAGCSPPTTVLPELSVGEPIRIVEPIRSLEFSLQDELGVVYVADLISTPSGYALADTGGWVLLLDRDFNLVGRFGGAGAGPKELELPQDLERLSGGRIAVFDSGNNRITVIDHRGELVATVPAGDRPLTDFAALGDSAFVAGDWGDRSMIRRLPNPAPSFGRMSEELWGAVGAVRSSPVLGTHLATDAFGRIHHFEEELNTVFRYGPDGSPEHAVTLPAEVLARIRAQAAEFDQSFGGRAVLGHTWMLGLDTFEDLTVLSGSPPGVEGLALVLNAEGAIVHPIVPDPSLPAAEFHHASRILLERDRVTTIKSNGLYQYRIEWPADWTSR